jgi:hypothetical protein
LHLDVAQPVAQLVARARDYVLGSR